MSTDFKAWMDGMDAELDEFLAGLPDKTSDRLSYSIASLDALEAWLLDSYSSIAALRDDQAAWDGATRYLGQVLVKHVDGEWEPDPDGGDRPNVVLGGGPWHEPKSLISAAVHRRTGNELRSLAEDNLAFLKDGGAEKLRRMAGQ